MHDWAVRVSCGDFQGDVLLPRKPQKEDKPKQARWSVTKKYFLTPHSIQNQTVRYPKDYSCNSCSLKRYATSQTRQTRLKLGPCHSKTTTILKQSEPLAFTFIFLILRNSSIMERVFFFIVVLGHSRPPSRSWLVR